MPCVDALALLEARQIAGNDGTAGCKRGKLLPDFLQWHARFLGDLEIESLTIFLQASEDFDHGVRLQNSVTAQQDVHAAAT